MHWTRRYSVRLAAIVGVVGGYLAANPEQVDALLELFPDGPARVLASVGFGLFLFAVPTIAVLTPQTPKEPTE